MKKKFTVLRRKKYLFYFIYFICEANSQSHFLFRLHLFPLTRSPTVLKLWHWKQLMPKSCGNASEFRESRMQKHDGNGLFLVHFCRFHTCGNSWKRRVSVHGNTSFTQRKHTLPSCFHWKTTNVNALFRPVFHIRNICTSSIL